MLFPMPYTYAGSSIAAPGSSSTGYAGFQLAGTVFLFLMLVIREGASLGR